MSSNKSSDYIKELAKYNIECFKIIFSFTLLVISGLVAIIIKNAYALVVYFENPKKDVEHIGSTIFVDLIILSVGFILIIIMCFTLWLLHKSIENKINELKS